MIIESICFLPGGFFRLKKLPKPARLRKFGFSLTPLVDHFSHNEITNLMMGVCHEIQARLTMLRNLGQVLFPGLLRKFEDFLTSSQKDFFFNRLCYSFVIFNKFFPGYTSLSFSVVFIDWAMDSNARAIRNKTLRSARTANTGRRYNRIKKNSIRASPFIRTETFFCSCC